MKKKCYPKYAYIQEFFLSGLMLLISIGIIFFPSNEKKIIIIICAIFLIILAILLFLFGLYNLQYYVIDNDSITIRSIFGEIERIKIENIKFEIVRMKDTPANSNRHWLCLYDKNENTIKFEKECTNRKNNHRIQIVYTYDNYNELKQYISGLYSIF